jgi:integrase/recombinase XerC
LELRALHASPDVAEIVGQWRDWLAHEKRQAPASVKAYQADLARFLAFCAEHLGVPPSLERLVTLSTTDFRAWLAARHRNGLA